MEFFVQWYKDVCERFRKSVIEDGRFVAVSVLILYIVFLPILGCLRLYDIWQRQKLRDAVIMNLNNNYVWWCCEFVQPACASVGHVKTFSELSTGLIEEQTTVFSYGLYSMTLSEQRQVVNKVKRGIQNYLHVPISESPYAVSINEDVLTISRRY